MGRYALILVACLSASFLLLAGCGAPEANNAQIKKADSPAVEKDPKAAKDSGAEKKAAEQAVAETEKPSDKAKEKVEAAKKDDEAKRETGAEKKDGEKAPEEKMDTGEQVQAAVKEPAPVPAEASASAPASASASAEESASASAEESASVSASAAEQREAATEEPKPVAASASTSASASAEESASAAAPADTTMYLTVPKMGIYDVPVVEGTTEASLDEGAGHVAGTGYPWVSGSNTYIAGHRIGYPGTPSDMVFWNLPNLAAGDEVMLTDSNGTTYTYAVSEILEVAPTDLSVTAPVGRDVVSLQTCIEDFGDYWTAGPDWAARYVVRADRVA